MPLIRSSSLPRALSVACVGLTLLTAPSTSHAQSATPSAGDMESARALVLEARVLRDKGDHAGALEKYKAAHALAHTPITGIELAQTYAKLGMPVEARDICLQVQRTPVGVAETERSAAARAEAVTFAEEMQKQAAQVRIVLHLPSGETRAVVTIDAHEVPFEAVGQVQRLNPGRHEVKARIGEGKPTIKTIDAAPGSQQDVVLDVVAAPDEKKADTKKVLPPDEGATHLSPLVPVGASIAGVGVAVGIVGGVVALKTSGELNDACTAKICPATVDIEATSTRAKTWATVSTIGFGVGVIGGVVALYGLLNPVKNTPTASTSYRLRVTPTLGGLSFDGHF